jgi:hypothetical protein
MVELNQKEFLFSGERQMLKGSFPETLIQQKSVSLCQLPPLTISVTDVSSLELIAFGALVATVPMVASSMLKVRCNSDQQMLHDFRVRLLLNLTESSFSPDCFSSRQPQREIRLSLPEVV